MNASDFIPTIAPPSTHSLIAQAPAPSIPAPVSTVSPLVEWGLILGAAGYFGKWALEQFSNKEKSESDMVKSLIVSQQNLNSQLLEDSRKSKAELIEQIALKDALTKGLTQMQSEVIRALHSQTEMQASYLTTQAEMQKSLTAIHEALVQLITITPACPHESSKPNR